MTAVEKVTQIKIVPGTPPAAKKMSNEDYHAHPAIGSTSIKRIIRSPLHFKYAMDNPDEPTPAKIFGQHCHEAILEPSLFLANTVVMPKFSGTGMQAKKDAWLMENHGKRVVKTDEMADILGILQAIKDSKTARAMLASGAAEESFFDVCPETGIARKARPDFIKDGHIIVDVKTTTNASPREFERDIATFGYHVSAAYYLDVLSSVMGKQFDQFIIIAVEKTPPHGIAIFLLDQTTIDAGRFLYRRALTTLKECILSNKYPGYPDKIVEAAIPQWAFPAEV